MIVFIQGSLYSIEPSMAVIQCQNIGYQLKISLQTYSALKGKKEVFLHTYLQIKEDAHILYGFAEPEEKNMFELLLGVTGIGGGTALTILSGLGTAELQEVIANQKLVVLKGIKGIGEKTAARILLELKDKIKPSGQSQTNINTSSNVKNDSIAALSSLGFKKQEVEKKIDDLLKLNPQSTVEELIRQVLKSK